MWGRCHPLFFFICMLCGFVCVYVYIFFINYSCGHLHSSVPTQAFTFSYIHSFHLSLHHCTLSRIAETLLPSPLHISSGTHLVLLYFPVFFCFLFLTMQGPLCPVLLKVAFLSFSHPSISPKILSLSFLLS